MSCPNFICIHPFLPPSCANKPVALAVASQPVWTPRLILLLIGGSWFHAFKSAPPPTTQLWLFSHNKQQKLSDPHFTSKWHCTRKQNGLGYWTGDWNIMPSCRTPMTGILWTVPCTVKRQYSSLLKVTSLVWQAWEYCTTCTTSGSLPVSVCATLLH